jgi:hypothetical protein
MAPFNFKCNLDTNFTLTQRVALLPTVKITDKGGPLGSSKIQWPIYIQYLMNPYRFKFISYHHPKPKYPVVAKSDSLRFTT